MIDSVDADADAAHDRVEILRDAVVHGQKDVEYAGSSRAGWSPKAATVTTNFTVMGKPAMVHAKFRLPFAVSPPVLATAAANAGIASSFFSQSEASIDAGTNS